jgi:hypothetical protein
MKRLILAGLILALAAPALAQSTGRAAAVELGAGWAGFGDEGLIHHAAVTGAARIPIAPGLGVGPELVYMIGPNDDRDLVLTGNLTWDIRKATATPRVVPFVVIGGGLYRHSDRFGAGSYSSTEGSFTLGGGFRIQVDERVYVAADARLGWEPHLRVVGVVGYRFGR